MKKLFFFSFLIISVVLAGCVPATTMPQFITESAPEVLVTAEAATVVPSPAPTEVVDATDVPAEVAVEPTTVEQTENLPAECNVYNPIPTPDPTQVAEAMNVPPAGPDDKSRGNPDAKIVLIEYSDFQCPYCAQVAPVLTELIKQFPDDIRVVFRHFPLPSHPLSLISAQAAEAAALQEKFFEYSDALFAGQADWSSLDSVQAEQYFIELAVEQGLAKDTFSKDLKSDKIVNLVKDFQDRALKVGIPYTPFVLVNGKVWQGTDLASMTTLINLMKHENEYYSQCPDTVIDPAKQYTATIQTSQGDIVINLFADKAPLSVNSLIFLSKENWYENQTFFEVMNDAEADGMHLVIGGDHTDTGYGSPGYQIDPENLAMKYDKKGLVGLVNASQLFITTAAQPKLDGRFTVIGEVVQGMEIIDQMTAPGEVIKNIVITEK